MLNQLWSLTGARTSQTLSLWRGAGVAVWRTLLLGAFTVFASGFATKAKAYEHPPSTFFPVGVYLQPTSMFDTWKSRGVNTVVDYWPGTNTVDQWSAAANQRGLYQIRAPRVNPLADKNEKLLLAWSQPDEPDYHNLPAAQLTTAYAAMKKADPNRPVYINFQGANVIYPYDPLGKTQYQAYMKGADWVANDVYPVTGWNRPQWIDYKSVLNTNDPWNATTTRWNAGTAVDQLRTWSGGKKQFAYIETSWQNLDASPAQGARGVTRDEFRGEVWDAIIHGAKGIIYFPQRIGNFANDATPADVVAEMTKQDALINSLGAVLNSSSDTIDNRISLTDPALEGTWRTLNGKKYLFVLNMSHSATSASIKLSGLSGIPTLSALHENRLLAVKNNSFTDSFGAYDLHVYAASNVLSASTGNSVPEPTGSGVLILGCGTYLLRRRSRNLPKKVQEG